MRSGWIRSRAKRWTSAAVTASMCSRNDSTHSLPLPLIIAWTSKFERLSGISVWRTNDPAIKALRPSNSVAGTGSRAIFCRFSTIRSRASRVDSVLVDVAAWNEPVWTAVWNQLDAP
jgi:hypothetical protein